MLSLIFLVILFHNKVHRIYLPVITRLTLPQIFLRWQHQQRILSTFESKVPFIFTFQQFDVHRVSSIQSLRFIGLFTSNSVYVWNVHNRALNSIIITLMLLFIFPNIYLYSSIDNVRCWLFLFFCVTVSNRYFLRYADSATRM